MRRFGRQAENPLPFWRQPPFGGNSAALREHGISAYIRDDGKTMMASGWAIWRQSGMHSEQARDLIIDGYNLWKKEPSCSYPERNTFLRDLLGTLEGDAPPPCPVDIHAAPRDSVMPAADYYGTIAWAGAELIQQAWVQRDEETIDAFSASVHAALTTMNRGFLSGRDVYVARQIATAAGLPDPFPVMT
jgi:hypothetical protein